jgi:O-antigen/teichoic acid export membrane protein
VLILCVAHPLVAALLVGKSFRSGSALMPWIGAGYALRATSYVFERVCYAYGETRKVLAIQLCAAVATVVATPVGVIVGGLEGAAIAVPIYFSIQLAAAIWLARGTVRRATALAAAPSVQHATVVSG